MTSEFWTGLLYICGAIVTVGGAAAVIIKMAAPYKNLKARVDKHDGLFENDNRRLKSLEDMNKSLCQAMVALLDHTVTGNSVERCRDARNKLIDYLATKG